MYLIALIDDATSTLLARLFPADSASSEGGCWEYVERLGRPQAVYTDRASVFRAIIEPRAVTP